MKKKNGKRGRVGIIITAVLVAVLIAANILGSTTFYSLLNTVMPGGGERAIFADGSQARFVSDYSNKKEALQGANDLNLRLCEEGMVLLKNENQALPLNQGTKISVFGKNSVNLAYGGSGSGGVDASKAVDLYASLESAGFTVNPVLKAFYEDTGKSGPARKANSSDLDSGKSLTIATGEAPLNLYTDDVKASYKDYSDAALVVFTRVGGEGFDLPRTMEGVPGAVDAQDTYLELDQNERDLLSSVCDAGFQRVVVLINSGAAMELTFLTDEAYFPQAAKIDAALWIGFPGASGATAVGEILSGKVNPSGKTVDTYVADLKSMPSFQNFGDNNQKDGDRYFVNGEAQSYYFVNYQEDIYVGYRYYETRAVDDGEEWYRQNVVFPFGYGLSYTQFDWELADAGKIANADVNGSEEYTVQVKVTNVGSAAGKDVVQLYAHAPYTSGGIEKPEEVLTAFAKTKLLAPGESDTVSLTFTPYAFASYDAKDKNQNGFTGYELEAGHDYCLYVAHTAHDKAFTIPFSVAETIQYRKDPVTGAVVANLYTGNRNPLLDSDYMLTTIMSRSAWNETFPAVPTDETRSVESNLIAALADVRHNNPTDLDSEIMPWFGEPVRVKLPDLLNGKELVSYDDPRWQTILDECNADELITMISYGAFRSAALENIGKPATNDSDGPAGFVNFMDASTYYDNCAYCCEVIVASTWNVDLAEEQGKAVGNEGLWGDAEGKSNGLPYSGWYAPGVNIHRSPFGGRNFEYYSEDCLLSGKMAAAVIRGCQSKGVYCFMKHFALNEQETHRSINGDCSWVSEQAMRELYLKPFEIAVKESGSRAVMSSFNRIGTRWAGGDWRLLTGILRNEWGFRGTVISDFNTSGQYMNQQQMAYAGGDLNLSATPNVWCDPSDTADAVVLANCAKNILYTVVNSNAMNRIIIGYSMPRWQIGMFILDGCVALGLIAWIVTAIRHKKKITKTA